MVTMQVGGQVHASMVTRLMTHCNHGNHESEGGISNHIVVRQRRTLSNWLFNQENERPLPCKVVFNKSHGLEVLITFGLFSGMGLDKKEYCETFRSLSNYS